VVDEDALVFRALADPTRRAILDALFEQDGQSVSALGARSPEMTRFGVMKHLRLLQEANLVTSAKAGRAKLHYLNPVPIAELADRWISKYAAPFTSALVGLDRAVRETSGVPVSRPAHVYQIYIAATPEQVWTAITDSDWTRRYLHSTAFVERPTAGQPYLTVLPDGRAAIDGMIEAMSPPAAGRPGRFVQTWHIRYDDELAAERPGRVEWTVTEAGDGLTLVRLVHSRLEDSALTWEAVKDGWVWVLDGMKTLIETGQSLPEAS
jgi:DNA-binding transcriptional ArsR family regulator/uncharacterized protein YndB with AHSA1/START domain